MTIREANEFLVRRLTESGISNAAMESKWLLQEYCSIPGIRIITDRDKELSAEAEARVAEAADRRCSGEPVQYILGSQDFGGFSYSVGNGVLIPRPETELLVSYAERILADYPSLPVLDICSGSGCIGLSVAESGFCKEVFLVEKSAEAFSYLKKNADKSSVSRSGVSIHPILADAFDDETVTGLPERCILLSNPPYIPSDEIASLQKEVRFEPVMALDGGNDGLDFYRLIARKYLSRMEGFVGVECGEGQSRQIADIFSPYCTDVDFTVDFNGTERCVTAKVKGNLK